MGTRDGQGRSRTLHADQIGVRAAVVPRSRGESYGGETGARPSSRAGTPGTPPAPLVVRRGLPALFLLLIRRFLFSFGGSAFDRVLYKFACYRINLDFVEAIRGLDVEGINQASFFSLKLL